MKRCPVVHGLARLAEDVAPGACIETQELFEREPAPKPGRAPRGDARGLDWNRAAAAKRIVQRRGRGPAGTGDESRGQVFLQRGFALFEAPSALEERFARKIQIQVDALLRKVRKDLHVRGSAVHRGAISAALAHPV